MKPIIRTITGFISVNDFPKFSGLLSVVLNTKDSFIKNGYEVQTIRITTDIIEQKDAISSLSKYEDFLSSLENNEDVSIYHLGSITEEGLLTPEVSSQLIDFFIKHKKAFLTIDVGSKEVSKALCLSGAEVCKAIASKSPFECRRFAVYAGVISSTPFYPASRVFSNSMKFAIGSQCANLAVEEALKSNKDVSLFEQNLRERMEKEFDVMASIIPSEQMIDFIGFDTSLAPFPKDEISIANAIEIILGKSFGSSGTLSVCRTLTKVMKDNKIQKTGLCGLMLPVIEDNVLAKRGIEGLYTWKELLLFSSVCATGLDTVPISGKTSVEDLADCYQDLATLAVKLEKPLSARLFIEPDKVAGETIKYDWEFACESPIFKV
jgi:uncharacterized protein